MGLQQSSGFQPCEPDGTEEHHSSNACACQQQSNSNSSGGLVPLPCPRGRDYHSNLVVGLYKSLRLSIEEVLGALLVSVPFQGKIMPYCNPPWAASMPFF